MATDLPFIDQHCRSVAATAEETWEALTATATGAFSDDISARVSRVLGCEHTEITGEPGAQGSTVPGFIVVRSERPRELALAGRHRFSRYLLIFRLEDAPDGLTLVRAETRATFPGILGSAYRATVIGTRGHVLATTRILRAIARRAERDGASRVAD